MAATDGNISSDVVVVEKGAAKMITLISSDGEQFDVTEAAAGMSQTIAHMIEDDCVEHGVPLPNVESKILAKVIEYCNKHAPAAVEAVADPAGAISGVATIGDQAATDLSRFDADFMKVDQDTLFHMILAANYLDIKGLLDLTCQTVADMIKGKTVEEIRKIFNIVNNFTPEEEEAIRKENPWAFE